jgi:hypothetical protein
MRARCCICKCSAFHCTRDDTLTKLSEDLDPLYSPAGVEMPQPLKLRRLSESFDMSNQDGIAV